ncbi:NAD(P)/FAD-dependent oxidoreductase [Salinarchaeum sp. IM2453]|uniref:digeranylgeranylglycerophospholipid reductase n=1 Tax=Salinarchaeum sp. IM2453 TaxID=2862870 RepID=UPI001C83439C|nr:digeranylgeranylglycerophospholipid reductase [Salinarchaeum sp. IM2453]QZA88260.1 NAD(P)/FAD-dependent oxidoreductase [Salinarchaeum sp. IM2453]
MAEQYDVVIAGAGPAGAQCARDLTARGYDVVVLERESRDGFPQQSNKSTGGTFPSMMSAFNIPDEVVMKFTDKVVLESPDNYFVKQQPGAVLEFADFKNFLVEDSEQNGAEYWFDAHVTAPITSGGDVVGVKYNGDQEVYADVIIDATGPAAPLAQKLGVSDLERTNQAVGVEYLFEGVELDHPDYADVSSSMMLRLDERYAPGGYAWIFHTGEDTAKVGVTYIQNERYRRHSDEFDRIDDYLDHWLDEDPRFTDAERIEEEHHRGSAHIQKPEQMTTDSFIAIGDTVPTIDPLWGEGIDKGMRSARAAATTIDHCLSLSSPDTSADRISLYEDLWHQRVAPRADRRLLMTKLLYYAPNERYDQLMADLKDLDVDALSAANKGNPLGMAKLFQMSDAPLLGQFLKEYYIENSI